jgi:YDG domain/Lamin Tail Domain
MKISTVKVLILMLLILSSCISFGQLIISQVYEGINDNKWIEITNTSLNPINLSSPLQFKIGIWQEEGSSGNGSISGNPTHFINLTGTLAKGQKYLIRNSNAASNVPHAIMPTANHSNTTVASFDGNDALAIFSDTNTIIDAFGVGINYTDTSLIRSTNNVYSNVTFDSSQWLVKTLATVATSVSFVNDYIGTHYFSGFFYITSGLSSLEMTYGGTSSVSSFQVSRVASNFLVQNIGVTPPPPPGFCANTFVTPPSGFELSTSSNFSSAIGTVTSPLNLGNSCEFVRTLYIRLAQNLNVGNYSGSILFSSDFIPNYSVSTHSINTVTPKQLTINGLQANDKMFDGTSSATLTGSPILNGVLQNDVSNLFLEGTAVANFVDEFVGNDKPVIVSGFSISGSVSLNYTLNQPAGLTASIHPVTVVHLKLFIQGFYNGQQQMAAIKELPNMVNGQLYVDDVLVELREVSTHEVVDSVLINLQTNGSAICAFPTAPEGNYYLSVKGSNSIQTWSSIPVNVSPNAPIEYDFSDSISKAYGNNLVDLGNGVFGLYSGDLNSDGNVDNSDYTMWETDSNNFSSGIFVTDLNGDGNVDNADYTIWEANSNSFIFSASPQN